MKALLAGIMTAGALMFAHGASAVETTPVVTSAHYEFVPSVIVIRHGDKLTFTNADLAIHSVTSIDYADGRPLFDSGLKAPSQSGPVEGVQLLAPSTSGYAFACLMHPGMRGTLIIL